MLPFFQFLHIGCDEVFQLGLCESCRKKAQNPKELFIDHVQKVAQYVRSRYHIQPIIWDDMLRNMNSKELQESQLSKVVEPMVWVYVEDIDHFVDGPIWSRWSTSRLRFLS